MSLTQLRALARRLEQQPQLVEHQRHVDGVAAQPLHAEQEGQRRLELGRQEQHLEVEEGLLAGQEVGLPCQEGKPGLTFSVPKNIFRGILSAGQDPAWIQRLFSGRFFSH